MWSSTRHGLKKLQPASVSIDSVAVNPVKPAKSLGVILDDELKLAKHVAMSCRSSYYQIWQLKHICRYLNFESAKTLVHSFVTSQVDFCNSLLASAPWCTRPTSYNVSLVRQLVGYFGFLVSTSTLRWRSRSDFIGCVFRNARLSSCVHSHTSRSTARFNDTWRSCATRSPATPIAGTSAQPARTS